jgi:hypothetical protein
VFVQYPDWIAANRGKHTPEAFAMFDKQFDCFSRLSVELDQPGEDTTNVMALMQEVCGIHVGWCATKCFQLA